LVISFYLTFPNYVPNPRFARFPLLKERKRHNISLINYSTTTSS